PTGGLPLRPFAGALPAKRARAGGRGIRRLGHARRRRAHPGPPPLGELPRTTHARTCPPCRRPRTRSGGDEFAHHQSASHDGVVLPPDTATPRNPDREKRLPVRSSRGLFANRIPRVLARGFTHR